MGYHHPSITFDPVPLSVWSSSFPKIILYARVRPDRRDVIITICCVMIAKVSFFIVRLSEIGGHPADVPWLEGTVGREFNGTLEVRGCVTGTLRAAASKSRFFC